jgi:hypothetical protein
MYPFYAENDVMIQCWVHYKAKPELSLWLSKHHVMATWEMEVQHVTSFGLEMSGQVHVPARFFFLALASRALLV